MSDGTADVRHQVAQGVELFGSEAHVLAVGVHFAGVEIDLEV